MGASARPGTGCRGLRLVKALRVLVTGAGGQLGTDVVAAFDGHDVTGADHAQLDVGERTAVLDACAAARPDVIVHCGAYTAVDACESDPDRAFRVNALGTRHVVEGARQVTAHVVYLSTDYVFDGTKKGPYLEWDRPNPQSVYGRSKLGGELETPVECAIVRTAWVFGQHGHNILKTILRLAEGEGKLAFVDDQHGSPTCTADLAGLLRDLALERRPGVFHATNQGATTWYEYARAALRAAGHDPNRVRPVATADLDPPRPAPRPANSVLDNAALRLSGTPLLPPWEDALERTVRAIHA